MSRTSIPNDLIHRPEEVERDAARFDHLCRLAEEVALPIVRQALARETAATGAEVLTDEAKRAVQALAEDAAIWEEFDEKQVVEELQRGLSDEIPQADEEECREHARDFSQVLMSAWLECLRSAESENKIVVLSDYLLPDSPSRGVTWLMEQFGAERPKLPQILIDAIAWFAVNEGDAAEVMKTLRVKLFAEGRVVDLPFNLTMVGAPEEPVMALNRLSWDRLVELTNQALARSQAPRGFVEQPAAIRPQPEMTMFTSATARMAVEVLSKPVHTVQYRCLVQVASPKFKEDSIEARVQSAFNRY